MNHESEWLAQVSDRIKSKMIKVAERNRHKIPYTAVNGVFNDCSDHISWWTNGFWSGIMWQLYHATGEPVYKENAEETEQKMDAVLMTAGDMDHDSGFRWSTTSVANYRLFGKKESFNRAHLAADNLAGRFNPVGKFIRAWGNGHNNLDRSGWAIIDCMMNLPLLYWAYEEMEDPRYLHIAKMHADTVIKHFIRDNGSSCHIVEFDSKTGEFIQSFGGQGCAVASSWTRGQGWALYGFVLSYIHTKEARYLETARRIADYFISCIPESGLIPVDFCQPEDCTWEDSTAAAIAACGLLEIEKYVEGEAAQKYHDSAILLLKALDEKRCNWDENQDQLVEKCTGAYYDEEHEYPIIYGDYYFIEAIWKLTGQELFVW